MFKMVCISPIHQNHPHTNYSRQRSIAIKPRFKSSVKFKKIDCRFSDKKQLVDFAVVKELDEETNLYYYGARYLDPRTSRWITGDPAIYQGDYIPVAPINDEARKHNQNLPGMGGIFNIVNMHTYHYAGNNPVKYLDPTGRTTTITITNQRVNSLPQEFREAHGLIGTGTIYVVNSGIERINIDTYLTIVTDSVSNTISYYEITRHAPSSENRNLLAFNPRQPFGRYFGRLLDLGDGLGNKLELWNNRSGSNRNIRADITYDDQPDFIQIHVGGIYTNSNSNRTYTAGSLGCFGLNGKDAGNEGRDVFMNDIETRNRNSGGRIEIYVMRID